MKYLIKFLLFVYGYYGNAQTTNDSIITKGYNFTITQLKDRGVLHYDKKSISTVDRDTVFYNNYKLELPLINIEWWMQFDEVLTILYENDQIISIDPGRKNDLIQGKVTNWKIKKYKRKKRDLIEEDSIDLFDTGIIQIFKSDCDLLFQEEIYIKTLDRKIKANEVYHYSNGIVNILVINKGDLNNFIKKNIDSFRFIK